MSEVVLTQAEANSLLALEKHAVTSETYPFPEEGGSLVVPLVSADKREEFFLDISRGNINLNRGKYQNRARENVVLARLDFGGRPHRNPDDEEIACPHLHLYREGFGDKWAIKAPLDKFPNVANLRQTLNEFMQFCNITKKPDIEKGLL
jgi:hypothetical protein